jgi:hypothetical protein
VTNGHILTIVHNMIVGHASFNDELGVSDPGQVGIQFASNHTVLTELLRQVVFAVGGIICIYNVRRFCNTEGLSTWDWKKEEKGSGKTGGMPS